MTITLSQKSINKNFEKKLWTGNCNYFKVRIWQHEELFLTKTMTGFLKDF